VPFEGEFASKLSHVELIDNADIKSFFDRTAPLVRPERADIERFLAGAARISDLKGALRPNIVALDGSFLEQPIDAGYPSRQHGYIKIAAVHLDTLEIQQIGRDRFPDPFAVQRATSRATTLGLALPGAYVTTDKHGSAQESFRVEISTYLSSPSTRLSESAGAPTIKDTLVELLRLRAGAVVRGSDGRERVLMGRCPDPDCDWRIAKREDFGRICVPIDDGVAPCPKCGAPIYVTDTLQLFETFNERGGNSEAFGRVMLAIEHLSGVHLIRDLAVRDPAALEKLCLLFDGPLAVSGPSAWISRMIMSELWRIRESQRRLGLKPPLVMGLQKTGRLVEHLDDIAGAKADRLLEPGSVFPVSDAYRYRFIETGRLGRQNFGDETYYGQDFLVVLNSGRRFCICLAYPFERKDPQTFAARKHEMLAYGPDGGEIGDAIALLDAFQSDVYPNALIPTVLAHQRASLSAGLGGAALRSGAGRGHTR